MPRHLHWRQLCRALDARDCRVAVTLGVPSGGRVHATWRWRSLPADTRHHASRTLIRELLSVLVAGGIRPQAWVLERSANGQPRVAGPLPGFHVSLAYAETACVVSVARERAVGVDLELVASTPSDELPRHLFSSRESALLDADPEVFLTLWTLKEALAKEAGQGLIRAPERIETAAYAAAPAGVACRRPDGGVAFHGRFRLGGRCYALAHALGPPLA